MSNSIWTNHLLSLLLASFSQISSGTPEKQYCNGFTQFCQLPITKTMLLGSHNSYSTPENVPEIKVNQVVDVVDLLEAGVRYVDIDSCKTEDGRYVHCHKKPIHTSKEIKPTIEDIKKWVDKNPNEVIVLNYGDLNGSYETQKEILDYLESVLSEIFGEQGISRADNITLETTTMSDLIAKNKRVVLHVSKYMSPTIYYNQDEQVCGEWFDPAVRSTSAADLKPAEEWAQAEITRCKSVNTPFRKIEWALNSGRDLVPQRGGDLASVLQNLVSKNAGSGSSLPYTDFNVILTDYTEDNLFRLVVGNINNEKAVYIADNDYIEDNLFRLVVGNINNEKAMYIADNEK